MSMLQKFATGTRTCSNTKSVTGGYGGVVYCGNDYTDVLAQTAPTDSGAETPYAKFQSKHYSTTKQRNLGGATKIDGTTVVDDTMWKWYKLPAALKLRKIAKRYSKYGVSPTAVNTKLWNA